MASRYSVHTEHLDKFNSDSENIVISQNKRIFESILQEQQSRNELYTIDSSVITEQEQQHNTQQSSSTTTEFVNSVLSNDVYDVETFINEMEDYPLKVKYQFLILNQEQSPIESCHICLYFVFQNTRQNRLVGCMEINLRS